MKQPKLNEDLLNSGVLVYYKGKKYTTGNRYHTSVELYKNGKFIINIEMDEIKVINIQKIIKPLKRKRNDCLENIKKIDAKIKEWEQYELDK